MLLVSAFTIFFLLFVFFENFVGFSLKLKLITFNEIDSFDEKELKCIQ